MSIEETQELPAGWRWAKIMEVAERLSPGQLYETRGLQQAGATPIVTQSEDGYAGYHDNSPGVLASPEEPIVTFANHTCAVRLHSTSFSTIQNVFPLRGKKGIADTYFLYWLLKNRIPPSFYGGHWPKVIETALPLPPLPEQKRIAAILTEKMAAVEKARAAAEERLKAAKELPAAYLREVFESEEAQGWPRKRLEEIAELLPSKSIATDGDAEVQAITTACLSEVGFLPAGIKTARMKSADVSQCIVSAGEILIARSNTPELVGRVAMFNGMPHGVVASDLTIRIMPNDRNNAGFFTSYLSFLYLTGYWKDRAGGASGSMKKITRGQILAETVPVPLHEEQQRIIVRIREKSSSAQKLTQQLQDELTAIKELPAALLRQAFAGEL